MTFDYIVVGGGSAGCVTANRLVLEHGAKVLMIERGGSHRHPLIDMPAGSFKIIFGNNTLLKRYQSVPQASLGGRVLMMGQANVLGGGSSINALAYTRGARDIYDQWNTGLGGVGWGWNDLLPYFIRQEGNRRLGAPAHGQQGPLAVSDVTQICASSRMFVEAMQARGLPLMDDFNAGSQRGTGYLQINTARAKRCSAANAFLDPIYQHPNLTVATEAQATKILLRNHRAVGIEYCQAGQVKKAECSAEIILTAGAYDTPKLLMLSGIGPAAELTRHGIGVTVDLPGVGQGMQDHNMVPLVASTNGAYGYFGEDRGLRAVRNYLQYKLFGTGPIATNGAESMAFINLDDPAAEPNVQIYNLGIMRMPPGMGTPGHGITLIASLIRPTSRGWMRLASADPLAAPEFSPNYFEQPDDLALGVKAVRYMREILATQPLAAAIHEQVLPSAAVQNDAALAEYCKRSTITNHHPVGSCRMGRDSDALAVLDPTLKVRGIDALRVFDASAIPLIPSANINAPVMALADRGVDLMTGRASLTRP